MRRGIGVLRLCRRRNAENTSCECPRLANVARPFNVGRGGVCTPTAWEAIGLGAANLIIWPGATV